MPEFFGNSTFFFVAITLGCFALANLCQQRLKQPLLNPILVSAILVIAILKMINVPNTAYQVGCHALSFLLTPATICLAISFYEQFQKLKHHIVAVLIGVLAGTVCSIGFIYLMCNIFGLTEDLIASLLPKSVTTAIGVALADEIGGIAAITTAAIAITGIFGNIVGPLMCRIFGLKDEVAQGVAFGTSSHVIGTAKATEMSELAGAVSSLSLTIAGIITTILLSFQAQYL